MLEDKQLARGSCLHTTTMKQQQEKINVAPTSVAHQQARVDAYISEGDGIEGRCIQQKG